MLFKDLDIVTKIRAIINSLTEEIYSTEEIFFKIKDKLLEEFPTVKFVFYNQIADDVTDKEEQLAIILLAQSSS